MAPRRALRRRRDDSRTCHDAPLRVALGICRRWSTRGRDGVRKVRRTAPPLAPRATDEPARTRRLRLSRRRGDGALGRPSSGATADDKAAPDTRHRDRRRARCRGAASPLDLHRCSAQQRPGSDAPRRAGMDRPPHLRRRGRRRRLREGGGGGGGGGREGQQVQQYAACTRQRRKRDRDRKRRERRGERRE